MNSSTDNERASPPADAGRDGSAAPAQPNLPDPRRRLRELLSIPESVRTDPQWDEIIELEIQMAPGNRVGQEGHSGGKAPRSGGPVNNPPKGPGAGNNFKRRKFPKPKKPVQAGGASG